MRTAVVSDLHLGAGNDSDLLRHRDALECMLEALDGADRLVLLGDVIELRDRPFAAAVELAAPVLGELAAAAGDDVVLVPGNHDHRFVSSWLEQRIAGGGKPLGLATRGRMNIWPTTELASALGDSVKLRISYPGFWIRRDVYATHGHYLDRHLTIPTFERLGLALVERTLGMSPDAGPDPLEAAAPEDNPDTSEEYERIVAPIYAFLYELAQAGAPGAPGGTPSKRIWDALQGGDTRVSKIRGWLLGSVALPGAVGVANRLGLGPVRADLSAGAIAKAGVAAMAEVVRRLEIDARWVVFGHTHRRGPLPGEDDWEFGKTRLLNTGSWVHSPTLLGETSERSGYWPGTVAIVEAKGAPKLVHALDHWSRETLASVPESE